MILIIKGKGGQGVLFLAKVLGNILLLEGYNDFTFLKEFDEGQRNGEIKITFNIPINKKDKTIEIKEDNIKELKIFLKELDIGHNNVKEALIMTKPDAALKNYERFKK